MATILNIETSTSACSVALTGEGMVLCHAETFESQNHAVMLSDFIKKCLDHAREHELDIDAIAVSIGPGSYTGLRIGLSEVKGLAYALDKPLLGINTLKLLTVTAMFSSYEFTGDEIFLPMLDARRMEVYMAAYDMEMQEIISPRAMILEPGCLTDLLPKGRKILCFGDGSLKAREHSQWIPEGNKIIFLSDIVPLATNMIALSDLALSKKEFIDLAYSTPEYLKEFQGSKTQVHV